VAILLCKTSFTLHLSQWYSKGSFTCNLRRLFMKRYFLELGSSIVIYMIAIFVSTYLLDTIGDASPIRVAIALLPMIPAVGICWVVIRQLRRLDELQRKIQFEALSWAFGLTAVATFSYGFLETVGYPKLSYFFIWPLMAVFWIIGIFVSLRRYS